MNTPKYVEIINDIVNDIESGKYKAGDRLPTEAELIKTYGVSRIVVSNALSRLADRGIIIRSQGKGSFVADKNQMSKNESEHPKMIAVIMQHIKSKYTMSLATYMVRRALEKGYKCAFFFTSGSVKEEEELLRMVAASDGSERMYSGALLMSCGRDVYNKEIFRTIKKKYPIVLFDRNLPGIPLTSIHTDNVLATRLATSELVELGHKRIAVCVLTTGQVTSLAQRIEGFILEMSERNIMIDPTMIIDGLYGEEQKQKLKDILLSKRASAVICLNARTGSAVIDMMNEWGLRCPEDVSIIIIDKMSTSDSTIFAHPTCVLQDAEAIAEQSVDKLIELIEGGEEPVAEQILIKPSLQKGFSTAEYKE